MKVPSKRKGNRNHCPAYVHRYTALNESPFEKEGKFVMSDGSATEVPPLNESPFEKEGK